MKKTIILIPFVLIAIFIALPKSPMKCVAIATKGFRKKQRNDTEKFVYEYLKKSPLQSKVTYVASAWDVCGEKKECKVKNGFTVVQADSIDELIPTFKKIGIDTVFAVNATERNRGGVTIIPFPYVAKNGALPAEKKDIWFSFVGWDGTHPCRKKIPLIADTPGSLIIMRDDFGGNFRKTPKVGEYQDIISRSRFSLCPRGNGPNSTRFYESLQAGAIPVLISDDLLLPDGIDWGQAIVRVKESEIETIPEVLAGITPEQEEQMRELCLNYYKEYVEGENITRLIREQYLEPQKELHPPKRG